jgi:hypothetical protein
MPDILEIEEKLQDTTPAIAQLERALAENPNVESLALNLSSLYKRHEALESVFLELASQLEVDVCRYRLFVGGARTTITALADAWRNFQTFFSVTYDALKNGPKERGRLSFDALEETSLGFAYSFTGSVGIVLTLPNDRLLLGETLLDETVRRVFEMARSQTHEQVAGFVQTMGPATIRAMYSWANAHVQNGLGAEIQWQRAHQVRASLFVQEPELARLVTAIQETSEETREQFTYTGTLRAVDLDRRTFRLELDDESSIRGSLDDAINAEHAVTLPRRYTATVIKTTKVYYSTEEEDVSYHLVSVQRPEQTFNET